jgi:hypothetical protein
VFVLILLLVSVILAAAAQLMLKIGVDRFGTLSFDEPFEVLLNVAPEVRGVYSPICPREAHCLHSL